MGTEDLTLGGDAGRPSGGGDASAVDFQLPPGKFRL